MPRGAIQITEGLGEEMQCSRCHEFWPNDGEFFYQTNGRTRQPCKACYAMMPSVRAKEERRRKRPAADQAPANSRYCPACNRYQPMSMMRSFEPGLGWFDLRECKACMGKGRKSA